MELNWPVTVDHLRTIAYQRHSQLLRPAEAVAIRRMQPNVCAQKYGIDITVETEHMSMFILHT